MYKDKMDTLSSLLEDVVNPNEFLAQSLRLNETSLEAVVKFLSEMLSNADLSIWPNKIDIDATITDNCLDRHSCESDYMTMTALQLSSVPKHPYDNFLPKPATSPTIVGSVKHGRYHNLDCDKQSEEVDQQIQPGTYKNGKSVQKGNKPMPSRCRRSRDVESNPGPRSKDRCNICRKVCTMKQKAIQCDTCDEWYHASCLHMNTPVYYALGNKDASWHCVPCGLPQFTSGLFDSFDADTSNPYNILNTIPNQTHQPLARSTPVKPKSTKINTTASLNKPTKEVTPKYLKTLVINFQSIRNKTADLEILLQCEKPDIIAGTETWLHPEIYNAEIFNSNYEIFRKDRADNHGGVLLAIKNTLIAEEITLPNSKNIESTFCKINTSSTSLIIGSIYRPPNSSLEYMQELCNQITTLKETNKNAVFWIMEEVVPPLPRRSKNVSLSSKSPSPVAPPKPVSPVQPPPLPLTLPLPLPSTLPPPFPSITPPQARFPITCHSPPPPLPAKFLLPPTQSQPMNLFFDANKDNGDNIYESVELEPVKKGTEEDQGCAQGSTESDYMTMTALQLSSVPKHPYDKFLSKPAKSLTIVGSIKHGRYHSLDCYQQSEEVDQQIQPGEHMNGKSVQKGNKPMPSRCRRSSESTAQFYSPRSIPLKASQSLQALNEISLTEEVVPPLPRRSKNVSLSSKSPVAPPKPVSPVQPPPLPLTLPPPLPSTLPPPCPSITPPQARFPITCQSPAPPLPAKFLLPPTQSQAMNLFFDANKDNENHIYESVELEPVKKGTEEDQGCAQGSTESDYMTMTALQLSSVPKHPYDNFLSKPAKSPTIVGSIKHGRYHSLDCYQQREEVDQQIQPGEHMNGKSVQKGNKPMPSRCRRSSESTAQFYSPRSIPLKASQSLQALNEISLTEEVVPPLPRRSKNVSLSSKSPVAPPKSVSPVQPPPLPLTLPPPLPSTLPPPFPSITPPQARFPITCHSPAPPLPAKFLPPTQSQAINLFFDANKDNGDHIYESVELEPVKKGTEEDQGCAQGSTESDYMTMTALQLSSVPKHSYDKFLSKPAKSLTIVGSIRHGRYHSLDCDQHREEVDQQIQPGTHMNGKSVQKGNKPMPSRCRRSSESTAQFYSPRSIPLKASQSLQALNEISLTEEVVPPLPRRSKNVSLSSKSPVAPPKPVSPVQPPPLPLTLPPPLPSTLPPPCPSITPPQARSPITCCSQPPPLPPTQSQPYFDANKVNFHRTFSKIVNLVSSLLKKHD
ncbi:formin-like protein 14 [Biomphalaria glabrata]